MISSGLRDSMSRNTSLSGKIAPSISAQVVMRARPTGLTGNMLSPPQNALPINAPAIPCVMVSMGFFCRLTYLQKSRLLLYRATHVAARHAAVCHGAQCFARRLRGNGHQKPAGGLRIEEQFAVLGGNPVEKFHTLPDELAVVFQPARQMSLHGRFARTRQIVKRPVIDLERNRRDSERGTSDRHFPGVAEQSEPSDIGHRM